MRICVAWDGSTPAHWALAFAARLARDGGAELTVVHVTAPVEAEVVDLDEARRPRRTLVAEAAGVGADPRLLAGRAADQLLAMAGAERADLLVAGTRPLTGIDRLVAPRLRHALLGDAPCPVALVRRPPVAGLPYVLACEEAALSTATELGAALRRSVVVGRLARHPSPMLAVIGPERAHGLRRRLGASAADDLIEQAGCPVVVAVSR
jgi:nucleotide-binding universal stress UspA family protein